MPTNNTYILTRRCRNIIDLLSPSLGITDITVMENTLEDAYNQLIFGGSRKFGSDNSGSLSSRSGSLSSRSGSTTGKGMM